MQTVTELDLPGFHLNVLLLFSKDSKIGKFKKITYKLNSFFNTYGVEIGFSVHHYMKYIAMIYVLSQVQYPHIIVKIGLSLILYFV